jgi:hypothetical protein
MLAGRRAFEGEDVTDTLAAIVRGEPDWKTLPASTPPALRVLIERCLVKDRTERLPDMSVVRFVLAEPSTIAAALAPTAVPRPAGLGMAGAVGLVVAAVAATAAIAIFWPRGEATPDNAMKRLTIVLPDGDQMGQINMAPIAVSPNGDVIAYSAIRNGKVQLFVRNLADAEPTALPGTDGASSPFFKPDGRWVGFFAQGQLKKITTAGNALQVLAEAGGRGGAWSADDTIYFAATNIGGLNKVSASGGTVSVVTTLDRDAGEVSHRWPAVLLTSLTTIAGLLPIMFETSLQAQFLIPMAISMVFGLAYATFLVLFFVPGLLTYIESAKAWLRGQRTTPEGTA